MDAGDAPESARWLRAYAESVPLSDDDRAFIGEHPSAAMITLGADGRPKAVRIGVAVVDGVLLSSGLEDRVRTDRLRHDPRCTLFVFDDQYRYRTLECDVTVADGSDVPARSLRLFRQMQHKPTGPLSWFGGELEEDEFLQTMVDEGRVLYELEVTRSYGM